MTGDKREVLPTPPPLGGVASIKPPGLVPDLFGLASIFESFANNPQNRVYKDKEIHLDGYVFTNCCFIHCDLYTENGLFVFKSCTIMQDCSVLFGPAALRIVKFFNLKFGNAGTSYPVFSAVNEPHGSITID
jgi:hypothetical protein